MRKRGFTLIELLVVIAIIGILATLMLMGYRTIRQRARDTQRKTNARSFLTGLEMYYDNANRQSFPTTGIGSVILADIACDDEYQTSFGAGPTFTVLGRMVNDGAVSLPTQPTGLRNYCIATTDGEDEVTNADNEPGDPLIPNADAWLDRTTAAMNGLSINTGAAVGVGTDNAFAVQAAPAQAAYVGHDLESSANHFWARTAQ